LSRFSRSLSRRPAFKLKLTSSLPTLLPSYFLSLSTTITTTRFAYLPSLPCSTPPLPNKPKAHRSSSLPPLSFLSSPQAFTSNFASSFRWWDSIFGTDVAYHAYRKRIDSAKKGKARDMAQAEEDRKALIDGAREAQAVIDRAGR